MSETPSQPPHLDRAGKPIKLYGPKQLVIIIVSALAGIGLFLFRSYHENGRLGMPEVVGAVGGIVIVTIILVLTVRKGNRPE